MFHKDTKYVKIVGCETGHKHILEEYTSKGDLLQTQPTSYAVLDAITTGDPLRINKNRVWASVFGVTSKRKLLPRGNPFINTRSKHEYL